MAYVSLYRRYRPDTFDKVIGQGHIVRTLVNQIKTGNVSHAYLFTGTRGTGKTSVARIFARAINCDHPRNGNPCGECPKCLELKNPGNMDIIEIDAASNSTVDEIRDLREKVKYLPVVGRYKVYIIDEVHMLSTNAFNALLKTLEEPPPHVVFILCTTDVHKLPATILSRCMRFDFKLLSIAELSDNLRAVFKDIGKRADEEAIALIASAAEGSVRDSLSIADMCAAYSGREITYADVLDVLGASDPNVLIDLCSAVAGRNVPAALGIINGMAASGRNISVITKDVSECFRNALYIRNCSDAESVLRLPKDIFSRIRTLAEKTPADRLLFVLDLFNGLAGELRYSTQPRILLEAAAVRACTAADPSDVESRLRRLEAALAGSRDAPAQAAAPAPVRPDAKTADPAETWSLCRSHFATGGRNYPLAIAMEDVSSVRTEGNVFAVSVEKESSAELLREPGNRKAVEDKLEELSGIRYALSAETAEREAGTAERLKKIFGEDIRFK